ncbi:MAG: OmpA family protein [Candidatus Omnitrophica bacterium]|nr:OmpA family protein [Candidatus Omnitrophota bacterium]
MLYRGLKKFFYGVAVISFLGFFPQAGSAWDKAARQERHQQQIDELQKEFQWWPTDAKPAPVKDEDRGGYWWMPTEPGQMRPWGNRGYLYVYKIIYDYKAQDDEPPSPGAKPSLLIKKIIRNVKIYFDYNKAELRDDHLPLLDNAVKALERNLEANILITGNCDARGSSEYNLKLGKKRGEVVEQYMLDHGISQDRVKIISRGKLDAVAPISDLVGMQKDRNAQFMVAEVEEILIPGSEAAQYPQAQQTGEGNLMVEDQENVETAVKVSTHEYVVQKNDSLSKIAQQEMGAGHRWKYLYELNKDRIKDPNKLREGQTILIPVE